MFKAIFNENCLEIGKDSNLHTLKGSTGEMSPEWSFWRHFLIKLFDYKGKKSLMSTGNNTT